MHRFQTRNTTFVEQWRPFHPTTRLQAVTGGKRAFSQQTGSIVNQPYRQQNTSYKQPKEAAVSAVAVTDDSCDLSRAQIPREDVYDPELYPFSSVQDDLLYDTVNDVESYNDVMVTGPYMVYTPQDHDEEACVFNVSTSKVQHSSE